MGADLLITTLAHKRDTTLDWGKGRAFVQDNTIPEDVLEEVDPVGHGYEEGEDALLSAITHLENYLETARSVTTRLIHGSWVHIIGGTSWGDDPSEAWTAATRISAWDDLLSQIGFLTYRELESPDHASTTEGA